MEDDCEIIEFALRQPLAEKLEPFTAAVASKTLPKILGISVSIWNHLATIEFLKELEKLCDETRINTDYTDLHGLEEEGLKFSKPIIILGGPEVSHLPEDAEILQFADHVIRGEGEIAFRELCENILRRPHTKAQRHQEHKEEKELKSAYYLYSDEDVKKKLIYVESSRGCAFNCDFCLSSLENKIYEFPLEEFLSEMDILIQRGVKTFKFLDRSFNINIPRALQIIEFFLGKIESFSSSPSASLRLCERSPVIHFEIVPSILPPELLQALARFPPGTLRLEIGIQTLNPQVGARINRPSNPEKDLEALRLLREKTNAIIHADLIAGLPGEDLASFGSGFDRLWDAIGAQDCTRSVCLEEISEAWRQRQSMSSRQRECFSTSSAPGVSHSTNHNVSHHIEIQLGILKKLPGAPIARHDEEFKMRYNPLPPYDIEETSAMSVNDIQRIKNFARFWEIIVNRKLADPGKGDVFWKFMTLSDELYARFGRNWGIDKEELKAVLGKYA